MTIKIIIKPDELPSSEPTPPPSAACSNLQALYERISQDLSLEDRARRDMLSGLATVGKVLGKPLHTVPTAQLELRQLINDALPEAAGVRAARWRNTKSLLRKALAVQDPEVIPARSRAGLLPAWSVLLGKVEAEPLLRGLARFSKYCSVRNIEPAAVDQDVYDRFFHDLDQHCMLRSPRETQQTAGRAWNLARALVPSWPQTELMIGSFRRNPSRPWTDFPAKLLKDVEAYLTPRADEEFDFTNESPRMRQSTIVGKTLQLRQFATAAVEGGREIETLNSLGDLVAVDTARIGLQVLLKRAGGTPTTRTHGMAYLLLSIARHWVHADESAIKQLVGMCKKLAPKKVAMVKKNKRRLAQFDDPRLLLSLLGLPARMMEEATRSANSTVAEARIAQMALVIELLLSAPIRIKNLSELELGRTLILSGKRAGHIVIDASEVKNDVDLYIPLPKSALLMVDIYVRRFHPLLAPEGCRMLFPSQDGGHKRTVVLSNQLKICLRRRCGIDMNAHLFRHLAAKIFLDSNPGQYGVIRLLLGHRNIETTIRAYCGTETVAAYRVYDEAIARFRSSSGARTPNKSPSTFRREAVARGVGAGAV